MFIGLAGVLALKSCYPVMFYGADERNLTEERNVKQEYHGC